MLIPCSTRKTNQPNSLKHQGLGALAGVTPGHVRNHRVSGGCRLPDGCDLAVPCGSRKTNQPNSLKHQGFDYLAEVTPGRVRNRRVSGVVVLPDGRDSAVPCGSRKTDQPNSLKHQGFGALDGLLFLQKNPQSYTVHLNNAAAAAAAAAVLFGKIMIRSLITFTQILQSIV